MFALEGVWGCYRSHCGSGRTQELFIEQLAQLAMEQVNKTKRKTVQQNDIGTARCAGWGARRCEM